MGERQWVDDDQRDLFRLKHLGNSFIIYQYLKGKLLSQANRSLIPSRRRFRMIKIVTDSSMDFPEHIKAKFGNLYTVPMIIYFGEEEFFDGETLTTDEFYRRFKAGPVLPKTATPMMSRVENTLRNCAADGSTVIALTLSSGLSGTYDLFRNVGERLRQDEGLDITAIDSLSASLGGGLIAIRAAEMAAANQPAPAIIAEIEKMRSRMNHVFTVDTLEYLWRGGRVTRAEAFVGNVLDIKPILHMLDNGHITAFHKVRGRKKALQFMADWVIETSGGLAGQDIGVIHWDCENDALEMAARLRETGSPRNIEISKMSATVGVHTGPGLLGIVFQNEAGRR
ncbi:MAG TPA: hypothetical protein DHD79_05810 [Firmicutes bacterium]|jgi:DegV family protein with EDD domain|nr:hypothetical protein [Bacillota bacterium]HCX70741.1 hypothetical protein [Bacillota bacterium]